ncbi:MAG: hypothetical protein IRY99_22880 [Isosphaeraceae bacterium]|nr:hypothetical protein [Isosphaeraceae bacterium]
MRAHAARRDDRARGSSRTLPLLALLLIIVGCRRAEVPPVESGPYRHTVVINIPKPGDKVEADKSLVVRGIYSSDDSRVTPQDVIVSIKKGKVFANQAMAEMTAIPSDGDGKRRRFSFEATLKVPRSRGKYQVVARGTGSLRASGSAEKKALEELETVIDSEPVEIEVR